MTHRRRERPVFDIVVSGLGVVVLPLRDGPRNAVVTAAHEGAHAVLGDMYGIVHNVTLDSQDGSGETFHDVAAAVGARKVAGHENAIVSLAGAAAETIVLGTWAIAGAGSADDFRAAWRSLSRECPEEGARLARIRDLFLFARGMLLQRWSQVENVAGHILTVAPNALGVHTLKPGQARRILSGVETAKNEVFRAALFGPSALPQA